LSEAVKNEAWRVFLQSLPSEALAKEGQVQFILSITSVAVQFALVNGIYHDAFYSINGTGAVRVFQQLEICLGSRSKRKNRDKFMYFIDRVS
jgi:hypothetical protein